MEKGQNIFSSRSPYADEIDLFQLFADLWKKRTLILLCILIFTAMGVGYAFLMPKVYKAQVRLLPPTASDLVELKSIAGYGVGGAAQDIRVVQSDGVEQGLSDVMTVGPEEAFVLNNQMLQSLTVKKKLLADPELRAYLKQAFPNASTQELLKKLSALASVSLPNTKKEKIDMIVSVEWGVPDQAAEFANKWVTFAMESARKSLVDDVQAGLLEQIENVDNKINAKKKLALAQLDNELVQLREAREIADKNELLNPVDLSTENLVTEKRAYTNVMELRSLYLMGSKALLAEIQALEKRRESAGNYVPDLAMLEEERIRLHGIELEVEKVKTATVDAWAVPPERKIKPRRALVLVVSVMLGSMVGVVLALVRVLVEKRATT